MSWSRENVAVKRRKVDSLFTKVFSPGPPDHKVGNPLNRNEIPLKARTDFTPCRPAAALHYGSTITKVHFYSLRTVGRAKRFAVSNLDESVATLNKCFV